MINYLCTKVSQETIFKHQLLSIFGILSLKEICVLSIYVDACDECQMREALWFRREEEGERRSKVKRETPPRVVEM